MSMLTRSRQDAITRAVEMAESAGADAILGLRFDCSEITQNMSEVVAYGTAVKLVPLPGDADSAGEDSAATPLSAASATEPPPSRPASERSEPRRSGDRRRVNRRRPVAVPVERLTRTGYPLTGPRPPGEVTDRTG